MSDLSEMTPGERAKVLAAVEAQRPVRMTRPDGRTVTVGPDRVAERLAAGYTFAVTATDEGE
jgi:hypothetical protein